MSKSKQFSNSATPLTQPVFYMLMALAIKDRHGYDIMKQVEKDSQGKVVLGAGTLYGAIKRMLEEKLIVEINSSHVRRKYYRLTEKGRSIFDNELQRYNDAVTLAREKNLFVKPIVAKLIYAYV